nr:hypothetical protein [Tanacetum cinerariifolium]
DDHDIIHFDNSSDLPLSTSLNDLDNATLHIDGQSMEVDVPTDIIDVVDEDDDITDDEDALPHDLTYFDNEDLINVDDDGVDKTQFDLRPHMESPDWTEINACIQQHLQKAYNTNKATFKAQHWAIDPTTETYNVEKIRRARPENITASEWDTSFPGDMSPGNMCHRGTYFLTGKYVGPTVSSNIVAGKGIPYERSPATIPRRQVSGETYPHRQVAGESRDLSLGKRLNVVVMTHLAIRVSPYFVL